MFGDDTLARSMTLLNSPIHSQTQFGVTSTKQSPLLMDSDRGSTSLV